MDLFNNKRALLAVATVIFIVAIFLIFNEQAVGFIGSGGEFGGAGATGSW